MEVYLVGGAVRDKLLGLDPKDFDYVVIGSTEEELIQKGFQKVGISFPVFIHPITRDEYALPRGATLEEDLFHRDITINAMAMDSAGNIIDPYHGVADLNQKVIRHVSSAFREDAFRVFRVLRFKASFPDFTIAPETLDLMREILHTPAFKMLSPERIAKELRMVFLLPKPSIFFEELKALGGLASFFPELENLIGWSTTMKALDNMPSLPLNAAAKFACLLECLEAESVIRLGQRLMVPNEWNEAALAVAKFRKLIKIPRHRNAQTIVEFLYAIDAFRKPYLIAIIELVSEDHFLRVCYEAIKNISFKNIKPELSGKNIGLAIHEARVSFLKDYLATGTDSVQKSKMPR